MSITKVVLTGGPCAGKSTALATIQARFSARGYKVFVAPEAATEMISGMGISPFMLTASSDKWNYLFQQLMAQLQIGKENIIDCAAQSYLRDNPDGKVLVVCDRGLMDQAAYLPTEQLATVLASIEVTPDKALARYDGVIHLVSAAIGAEAAYNHGNAARSETVEQAAELDRRTLAAWIGHPHLRVIDNSTDFESKIERVIREISDILGEPVPTEREYKYLIEAVDEKTLLAAGAVRSTIVQVYLRPTPETDERRIRQRCVYGESSLYYTEKRAAGKRGERIEVERRITPAEYMRLLAEADPTARPIVKTRYCFVYKNQYFELDVYEGDLVGEGKAILEIELAQGTKSVDIPEWIHVIRDVTDDPNYKNAALARKGGEKACAQKILDV